MTDTFVENYHANVRRRRALKLPGYVTLAEAGFDGEWVTPYQISSCSPTGPVLVDYNWFDAPSAIANEAVLKRLGYMPGIPFNAVLDRALSLVKLSRRDLYLTQAFHLLPASRSQRIAPRDIDASFDAVTRHELEGRRILALGDDAAAACRRHGIKTQQVCHPSARGPGRTYENKAREIADALARS